MNKNSPDLETYLSRTELSDWDDPIFQERARELTAGVRSNIEIAVRIFQSIRIGV